MAVNVACMAIYWPTPSFKGRTFKLCVLISWDFNFCVRSSPLRDITKHRRSIRHITEQPSLFFCSFKQDREIKVTIKKKYLKNVTAGKDIAINLSRPIRQNEHEGRFSRRANTKDDSFEGRTRRTILSKRPACPPDGEISRGTERYSLELSKNATLSSSPIIQISSVCRTIAMHIHLFVMFI